MALANDPAVTYHAGDLLVARVYAGDNLVWEAAPVAFTVEGTTFEPRVDMYPDYISTLDWVDENDVVLAQGERPTITFPDATPREVRLIASVPGQIRRLNLGFNHGNDEGLWNLGWQHNWPTQPVTAIANLQTLSNLVSFCAGEDFGAYTGPLLGGHLNFSGMKYLEYIECYHADVETVLLTGCDSIIRVTLEGTNLQSFDLNPVRETLRDLRAANQSWGTMNFAPLEGPMPLLYHWCVRSQDMIWYPDPTYMPAVSQYWAWQCGLNIPSLVLRTNDPNGFQSVRMSRYTYPGNWNTIGHIDLAGATWQNFLGYASGLWAYGVGLNSIDLTGMEHCDEIFVEDNNLSTFYVDHILSVANGWGTSGGAINVEGNSAPSAAGLADVDALRARGWTVTLDMPTLPGTLLWADEFDRPNATGWQAVGNGWQQPVGGSDISIVNGELSVAGGSGYQRIVNVPAVLAGLRDYDVEIELDSTNIAKGWFGTIFHVDVGVRGGKVLFPSDPMTAPRGDYGDLSSGNDLTLHTGSIPATWDDPGVHLMRLRVIGSRVDLYLDNVFVGTRTTSVYTLGSASGIGFCGTPGKTYRAIRVYAIPA